MWGHEKLKEWVRENFACKGDVSFNGDRYWELMHKIDALYQHLGLEYKDCPGRKYVERKGGKGCQP